MITPANKVLECFIVRVHRNGLWRNMCHPHAPGVTYKFFTYNDADGWARRNIDDFQYEIKPETLVYNPHFGTWI